MNQSKQSIQIFFRKINSNHIEIFINSLLISIFITLLLLTEDYIFKFVIFVLSFSLFYLIQYNFLCNESNFIKLVFESKKINIFKNFLEIFFITTILLAFLDINWIINTILTYIILLFIPGFFVYKYLWKEKNNIFIAIMFIFLFSYSINSIIGYIMFYCDFFSKFYFLILLLIFIIILKITRIINMKKTELKPVFH